MSKSGTPRKVTINGQTFNVATDANFAQTPERTIEGVRHTGGTMFKETLNVENLESVTLITTGQEHQDLKKLGARTVPFSMSYELASGDVYRAVGHINLDNRETEENRVDIVMIPDGAWEPFLA